MTVTKSNRWRSSFWHNTGAWRTNGWRSFGCGVRIKTVELITLPGVRGYRGFHGFSFYERQHICYSAYMLKPVRPFIWITYSSYRYGLRRVVINAYFSSDLVQFDQGGTTQNLGRIVPEFGADRPRLGRTWGGSTRGGSTLGRIVCKPSTYGHGAFSAMGLAAWNCMSDCVNRC